MSASRPCEECSKVRRCNLYARATYQLTDVLGGLPESKGQEFITNFHEERAHLCRPCARTLGYTPRPQAKRRR